MPRTPGYFRVGDHPGNGAGTNWRTILADGHFGLMYIGEAQLDDAVLFAAAPDLLEELESMVDMFERHITGKPGPDDAAERWDAARSAIAKAKGE